MWSAQSSLVAMSIEKHFSQRQQAISLSEAYLACFLGNQQK
jgi:hypothetical protein